MSTASTPPPLELSFDRLRRIHATLLRRLPAERRMQVRGLGFAPGAAGETSAPADARLQVTARYELASDDDATDITADIAPVETVRLLDRQSRTYQRLAVATAVGPAGSMLPTGVRVEQQSAVATAAAVVRWTRTVPIPNIPPGHAAEDPRWRWGVVSAGHAFTDLPADDPGQWVHIYRQATCGSGPPAVSGRVVARGRVAGEPDISLIETGLDRLWLSGLLERPNLPRILPATQSQLVRWITRGTFGTLVGDGVQHAWGWQAYYPELAIPGIGRVQHVIRYEATADVGAAMPFGPGSSGGVLMAGGIPIGIQIAAMQPEFRIGLAQAFDHSLAWLQRRLRASSLQLIHLVMD